MHPTRAKNVGSCSRSTPLSYRSSVSTGVPVASLYSKLIQGPGLMYWSNYLNRSNLQFAYVSGMKEQVGFQGNDFSLANTVSVFSGVLGVA